MSFDVYYYYKMVRCTNCSIFFYNLQIEVFISENIFFLFNFLQRFLDLIPLSHVKHFLQIDRGEILVKKKISKIFS